MRETFERYLHTFLERNFLDYPGDQVASAWGSFEAALPLIGQDVLAKHPGFETPEAAVTDLFGLMQMDQALEAAVLYRLERALFLDDPGNPLLGHLAALMRIRTGIELYYSTDIGPGLNVQHGTGIIVGPRNRVGRNFMIHQCVTIGQQRAWSPDESVTIGDDVILFAGAKVFGNITIGDNVWVGANAVVVKDLEPNAVYAGAPARKIRDLDPKE